MSAAQELAAALAVVEGHAARRTHQELHLLRVERLARLWSVEPITILRRIRSGDLAAVRIGREYRVPASAARFFLARQTVHPGKHHD